MTEISEDAVERFTPGPWKVSDENRDDLRASARFGNVVVYAEDDCDVHPIADCSCNHTCRDEIEQLANATLISAAPDMYAALSETITALRSTMMFAALLDRLETTLRKARGQQ